MSNVERTEVEWGGDRYVATITSRPKDYLFTITRGGEVIAEPELLPLVQTRLAFNGSAGMLVGRATVNDTPAIYAVPVTNEGSVGEPTLLVTNSALGTLDVAPLDDGFIAVIALDTGELVAQRLDAFGTPLGTPQFLAAASSPMPLRAASGPSGILVSWREAVGDQAYFKTLAIRPDGTVGDVHLVLDHAGWDPHVVATDSGYLLVSARRDAGTLQNEPLALPLDAEGRPLGAPRALPGMPDAVAPATGGRVLVVSHLPTYTLESWMSASYLVGHDGTAVSQPEPIVVEQAPQREVRAASDGDAFMLAWITTTAAGERIDTSALATSSDDRTCRTARSSPGRLQGLALAGSPAGYLLVWAEANAIRASILQGDSWNEVTTGLELERRRELDADLAWDGDAFLFVWVEDRALRAARIAPTGAVSDLGEIASSNLVFSTPSVAVLPSGALITVRTEAGYPRYDYAPSGAMVFALDRSGSMALQEIEPLLPPTLSELVPDIDVDIAAGGTGAMLAMRDAHEVWAIALGSDGTPLRRTRIAGGIDVSNVAIAAVPGGFAISWIADALRPELPASPSATRSSRRSSITTARSPGPSDRAREASGISTSRGGDYSTSPRAALRSSPAGTAASGSPLTRSIRRRARPPPSCRRGLRIPDLFRLPTRFRCARSAPIASRSAGRRSPAPPGCGSKQERGARSSGGGAIRSIRWRGAP